MAYKRKILRKDLSSHAVAVQREFEQLAAAAGALENASCSVLWDLLQEAEATITRAERAKAIYAEMLADGMKRQPVVSRRIQ